MGGIGRAISGAFGSKNEEHAEAPKLDPNAFEYGGAPGQAKVAAASAGITADEQRGMAAESTGQKNQLYGYGQGQLGNADAARGFQNEALGMARSRAMGNDLISQKIAQQQQQQLQQQQAGAAASARGPASLALAQQGAAANTALGQSTIANQAAVSGAQEQLANQQAFANQASGIRSQDLGAANTALGAGVAYGGLGVQQGQLGLGYNQLQNQINSTQLGAQMQQQALQSGNSLTAQGINAQIAGQNAAMAQKNAEGAVSLGSSIFSSAAGSGSDERMKKSIAHITGYRAAGGPVQEGGIYGVGEQGPERFVPNKFGAPQEVVGQNGPEFVVPQTSGYVVPSTWGTDARNQPLAALSSEVAGRGHTSAQQAEYNRIASIGDNSVEKQTRFGMPGTLGMEIGHAVYGGNPSATGMDSQTQKGIAAGMRAAGAPSKNLERQAAATEAAEQGQSAAKADEPPQGMSPQQWADKDPEAFDKWADKHGWTKKEDQKNLGGRIAGAIGNYGKSIGYGQGGVDVSYKSDENAKLGIMPVGDLGLTSMVPGSANFGHIGGDGAPKTMGGYVMSPGGGGVNIGATIKANSEAPAHDPISTGRGQKPGDYTDYSDKLLSDMTAKMPTNYSDMTTKTPMMMSDETAKRVAFNQGRLAERSEQNKAFAAQVHNATELQSTAGTDANEKRMAAQMQAQKESDAKAAVEDRRREMRKPGLVSTETPANIARVIGNAYNAGGDQFERMESAVGGPSGLAASLYPNPPSAPPQQMMSREFVPIDYQQRDVAQEPKRQLETSSATKKFTRSDERTKEVFKKEAPMAAANRSQEGFSYAYKPQFTPPEQSPGEKNVGPMAQNMAANPIARTAVKRNADDGMLMLDNNKLSKLHSASIASLQDQIDALHSGIARILGRGSR